MQKVRLLFLNQRKEQQRKPRKLKENNRKFKMQLKKVNQRNKVNKINKKSQKNKERWNKLNKKKVSKKKHKVQIFNNPFLQDH